MGCTLPRAPAVKALSEGSEGDEMVGWPHQFNGHEFEQAPGDSEG